jgi:hypothetical protein
LQDTIYQAGEKPLRFLRYFILANYDVEVLREDEIYGWFVRNEGACGYAKAPLRFATDLVTAAKAYRNFMRGEDRHGRPNRYLKNIMALGGRAARQHLILLLAGRHLSDDLFDILCREVENLFFVYVVTREATRDFERNFASWANELKTIDDERALQAFVERRFTGSKGELSVRFDEAMRRLSGGMIQQYRLRYIVAKLTQYVDLQGFGEIDGTVWLARYLGGGNDIEHILPQNPTTEAAAEFGDGDLPELARRLGNLVLAEDSINRSLGNRPYSSKRSVYAGSQFLLTRALAERLTVGANTRIDRAVAELEPFTSWNAEAIERRQQELAALARRVWELPSG